MNLSVVIVNYNVKYFLENTISSVYEAASGYTVEIIVVDNASTDGSEEYIRSRFPDVVYIYNQKNAGFATANNQGLKIAGGEYILVLNPDTLLKDDTIRIMIEYLTDHPQTSMVSCKVNQPDGRLDTGCRRSFPTAWNAFCHISGLSRIFSGSPFFSAYNLLYLPEDQINEVDAVSGCFMFFRRSVLDQGIFLPEEYFMYGEDLDFCYQIKKQGLKIEYVPLTSIIHYRGQSSRKDRVKLRKHFYGSMNIFVRKNYSTRYTFLFKAMLDTGIFLTYAASVVMLLLRILLLPLIDLASFFGAIFSAFLIYEPFMLLLGLHPNMKSIKLEQYIMVSPVYLLIYFLFYYLYGNYTDKKYSFRHFLSTSGLIALVSVATTFFLKDFAYSRIMLLMILGLAPAFMLACRYLLFKRSSLFLLRTLVVGIDEVSRAAAADSRMISREGLYVSGFVDVEEKNLGKNIDKHPVYGNINNLEDTLKLEKIECVILSSRSLGLARVAEIAALLEHKKISYKILPELLLISRGRIQFLQIR